MTSGRRALSILLTVALSSASLSTTGTATAQPLGDAEKANALFEEGKQLMGAQRFKEACQRFEGSDAAFASGRALLNLADCLEKDGRFASAWAKFQACVVRARAAGLSDVEKYASDRAAALAPKLARLVLVPALVDAGGVSIAVDGREVERRLWDGLMVEPGPHSVVATLPPNKSWRGEVVAGAPGSRVNLTVPALEAGGASVALVPSPALAPAPAPSSEPSGQRPLGTQRLVAIAAGAVGVVVLGGGIYLGLSAKSSYDNPSCGAAIHAQPNQCNSAMGVAEQGSADTKASFSTAAFIVAGAALAGGAVLWFTAPKGVEVGAGVTPAGLVLRGTF
jgi:hypothetical protein